MDPPQPYKDVQPLFIRANAGDEIHHVVTGEDISMSSWPYGDPAPPILREYAGDPATPPFQAYTDERVIIRYLMPADKPRNISFVIHGHNWLAQPDDPFSTRISVQGAVSVGGVYNIELEKGASEYSGDYLYRSGSLKSDVESGMCGIFRVIADILRQHRTKHVLRLCT